jgi:hypothetical protein
MGATRFELRQFHMTIYTDEQIYNPLINPFVPLRTVKCGAD